MDTIRRSLLRLSAVPVLAALTLLVAVPASAQEAAAQATPGGLRAYWHVFIAYTIAILAVAAWAGSIAKRLADVEKRLGE